MIALVPQSSIVAPAAMGSGVGFGQSIPQSVTTGGGDNSLRSKVEQFFQVHDAESGDHGVNIEQCFGSFPGESEASVRKAIEELAEEGHIYSTINETHFKYAH